MRIVHNIPKLKDRRRELRQSSTRQEEMLWKILRGSKLGHKFKRQHSVGGYILDFYCAEQKLIIEIDGPIHAVKENKEYDKIRDNYFNDLGYKTVRFSNKEIHNKLEEVINIIKSHLGS